jgi:hypothetical protein
VYPFVSRIGDTQIETYPIFQARNSVNLNGVIVNTGTTQYLRDSSGQKGMGQKGMGQKGMGQKGMGQKGMGQKGMGQKGMGQKG